MRGNDQEISEKGLSYKGSWLEGALPLSEAGLDVGQPEVAVGHCFTSEVMEECVHASELEKAGKKTNLPWVRGAQEEEMGSKT